MRARILIGAVLVAALVSGLSANAEDGPQWSFGGIYLSPEKDEDWDKGVGAEVVAVFWKSETFGIALAGGLQQWTPNEDIFSYGETLPNGLGYGFASQLDGEAMLFPVGASGLWKTQIGKDAKLIFEAGIRYVFVQSDVEVKYAEAISGPGGTIVSEGKVDNDIDDGVIGLVAVDLQIPLSDKVLGFVGGGFQFDISKGGQKIGGEDIDYDNELKAAFLRAGIRF